MDTAKKAYRDAEQDTKAAYREVEQGTKKAMREADGHDVTDDLGNLGDEVRKDLGNAGDEVRKDLGNAGDEVRSRTPDPPTARGRAWCNATETDRGARGPLAACALGEDGEAPREGGRSCSIEPGGLGHPSWEGCGADEEPTARPGRR